MMKNLHNVIKPCPFLIFFHCLMILIMPHYAEASTHLWPLAAIYFDEPAPETSTFNMTDEEFRNEQSALERRITSIFGELLVSLSDEQQILLKTAQSTWQNYYEKYEETLKRQLDEPVKVFYGIEGQERKTNIYKDTILTILEQRAIDLESWNQGRYGYLEPDAVEKAKKRLDGEKHLLDEAFGANIYIMDEIFRAQMQEAQNSWYAFFYSNTEFVEEVIKNSEIAKIAEEFLQIRRMYDLTLLHKEGYVFFHREREE